MDWKAVMSSEVFREYVKNELRKDAQTVESKREMTENEEAQVYSDFIKFQEQVNKDPQLKQAFKLFQEKFANDPEYRSQVNPSFVDGVMLLDLDEETESEE